MASHNFEKYEGLLNATASQVTEFSTKAVVSVKNIYGCAWILHRYIYDGSNLVKIAEVDSDFGLIKETTYRVDEQMPLIKICKDLEPTKSKIAVINGHGDNPPILMSTIERSCDGNKDIKDNIHTDVSSGFVTMISFEGERTRLAIFFNQAKLDQRAAVSYWHTFDKIIQSILEGSDQLVKDVDYLSDHDRNQIIQWNRPLPEEPQEQTVCSCFDAKVRGCPDAPAIFAWDGEMSYAELDNQATRIAIELREAGVLPGSVAPFCMEKSKWAVVAALAILKAGAAVAPMDPAWPKQRLAALLEATESTVAVCSSKTKICFDGLGVRTFLLSLNAAAHKKRYDLQLNPPSSRDISFILFSSGSTGTPKGMVREHAAACIASLAHAEAMHLDSKSRVLQFANHVFDVAMLDFFTTLIVGGCVCVPSDSDRKNSLVAFIQHSGANWALLTPTIATMLDPSATPSLRDVTLGGEAISSDLLAKWLPHCRVGINYGSAEVDVTHTRDVIDPRDPANVGQRLSSCVTYIADPNDINKILPIGATGELLISGPTMARSYLKQPDRTTAAFVPAPVDWFKNGPDGIERPYMSRAYRMGDLLQQQWDGSFRFVGRRDFQIKINGQKVELGEIESRLATYPSARLCAVLYPRAGAFAERLVAIVEPQGGTPIQEGTSYLESTPPRAKHPLKMSLEDMKSYLAKTVPSYMVPQVFLLASSMPLTATLKVDRFKLMSWIVAQDPVEASGNIFETISMNLQGSKLSPEDRTGIELARLVANLVTVKNSQYWHAICSHDNVLSQIGLDSVQIMRLSYEISKTFTCKIPVETLTDHQMTVKRLSTLIDNTPAMNGVVPTGGMTSKRLRHKLEQSLTEIRTCSNEKSTHVTNGLANPSAPPRKPNVFLTGATGYLGIQILRALLESANIGKIYALVRGIDVMRAHSRLAKVAEGANWSIAPFSGRLEIWPGDLSQPRLGLEVSKYSQLTRSDQQGSEVQCIIHCGAVVDWTKSYEELEASNVKSTIAMLNASFAVPSPTQFTYISGGQYFRPGDDAGLNRDSTQAFEDAARSTGYAQTKFISEIVIDELQQESYSQGTYQSVSLRTIKPAYLIGTAQDGIASINDYLWRIVSAAVRQKSYNADEDDQWLLAADVGVVARVAIEYATTAVRASSSQISHTPIKILHGIQVGDFWSIVSEVTGCDLLPISSSQWMKGLKAAMESDPQHVLWPLLDSVEKTSGRLTDQKLLAKDMLLGGFPDLKPMGAVIRKNVEYLVTVGFVG